MITYHAHVPSSADWDITHSSPESRGKLLHRLLYQQGTYRHREFPFFALGPTTCIKFARNWSIHCLCLLFPYSASGWSSCHLPKTYHQIFSAVPLKIDSLDSTPSVSNRCPDPVACEFPKHLRFTSSQLLPLTFTWTRSHKGVSSDLLGRGPETTRLPFFFFFCQFRRFFNRPLNLLQMLRQAPRKYVQVKQ